MGSVYMGSSFWGKKLKSGVKSITMKTVIFSLVYIIKPSVHMHVRVNTHAGTHTPAHHSLVLFTGDLIVYAKWLIELHCLVVAYKPTPLLTKSSVTNFNPLDAKLISAKLL